MNLQTERLTLIPCRPALIRTLLKTPERFTEDAGFAMLPTLRELFTTDDVSPDWLAVLASATDADPWRFGFFVVEQATGHAIGSCGFTGPPNDAGEVEIAYGIARDRNDLGFATEAAAALVAFAQADARVTRLCAHTLPETNASTRVLTKNGFTFVGEETVPHDGLVWRWERAR